MNSTQISELLQPRDRELWVVTAADGERRGGLIATGVASASIVPELPRVLTVISRRHHTWELIEASGAFALHLLDESHVDWVWRFGLQSGRDVDKLDGVALFEPDSRRSGEGGGPILAEAVAWLDCRVENRMQTGDRTVYLAEVLDGDRRSDARPLTVQRLLELAPQDKRDLMKAQRQADAARDAEAIRAWRSE